MAQISRSWCQSALLRASREHSSPSTIPARPSDTSATRCWNPSRSAADAPEWPWSMSITVIWLASQPSVMALPRRSYWRIADSVLWITCLRLDWRTYKSAALDRWAVVTLDAAVPVSMGSLRVVVADGGSGAGEREVGQGVDELGGQPGRRRGHRRPGAGRREGGWPCGRGCRGHAGQRVPPGGDALAGQHAQAERERLSARVQGGMAQLLVAGVQPAARGGDLAGLRAGARFSSRSAR